MAVTQAQLQQLYLAYFGRPADFDGLVYYTTNPDITDIWHVAANFSASPESQALYGPGFSASVINNIYQNLFNRDAETDGLLYWSQEVASGRLTAGGAALGILLGAQNDDAKTVENKLAVAAAFTNALDTAPEIAGYAGDAAAAAARAFLHTVTADPASVTAAQANLDAAIAAIVAAGHPGSTIMLTTGLDNAVGTANNDTIVGIFGGATGDTLTAGDVIDGKGGFDTLQLTAAGAAPSPAAITVKNVEAITIRDVFGATFNAQLIENDPSITFTSTLAGQNSSVTKASLGSVVGISGGGNLTVGYANTSGTADTAKVSVNNAGATGAASTINVSNTNTIEGVSIATAGTNVIKLDAGTAAKTVTITGNGTNNITLDTVAGAVTVDASASTGANTLNMKNGLGTTDVIKGGTGADTLVANLDAAVLVNPTISGVETLSLDFDALATVNLSKTTGATTLKLSGSTANQTFTNAAASIATVNVTSQDANNLNLNLSYVTGAKAATTLNLGSTATTAAAFHMGDVNLANVDSLTISSVGKKAVGVDNVNTGALSALNINATGGGDLDVAMAVTSTGAIGAVNLGVGADSKLYVDDILAKSLGDVTMTVAAGGSGEAYVSAGAGKVGNVTVTANGDAAQAYLAVSADIAGTKQADIGNLTLNVNGKGASGYIDADASSGSIGNINVNATGESVSAGIYAYASAGYDGNYYTLGGSVGDVNVSLNGKNAYFSGYIDTSGGNVGNVSVAVAGQNAAGYITVSAYGYSVDSHGAQGDNGNVGNIALAAGGKNAYVSGYIEAYYGDVGNVALAAAGSGAEAAITVYAYEWGGSGASAGASGNVGDISVEVGDGAGASGYIWADGTVGNTTVAGGNESWAYLWISGNEGVGDLTVTMGTSAYFSGGLNSSAGDVGTTTITVGESSYVDVVNVASGGSIGDISITAGMDSDAYVSAYAQDDIGNIQVTADYVRVSAYASAGSVGTITVKDAGDASSAFIEVNAAGGVGDVDTTGFHGYAWIDLSGTVGSSTVHVGDFGSTIFGSQGASNLFGGAGKDWIQGGAAVDTFFGGAGADVFDFSNVDADSDGALTSVTDVILDFKSGTDHLNFSYGAGSGTNFTKVTTATATWADLITAADGALNGTIHYYFGVYNGDGFLFYDQNGTGITGIIQLSGVTNMVAADILS